MRFALRGESFATDIGAKQMMGGATDIGRMMVLSPDERSAPDTQGAQDARIVKNGSLALVVEDVARAIEQATDVAVAQGGFVQVSNRGEGEDGSRFGYATLRVPAATFTATIADLRALAIRVENESTQADDVTEQYTDLQAQLTNAQAEERAYLDLLARSGSVSDLLNVQRELSNVRGKIESLQGRINYLGNQADLATIAVNFNEDRLISAPSKQFHFIVLVRQAVQGLVSVLQWLVTVLVWAVIVVLPFILIGWLLRKGTRRFRK